MSPRSNAATQTRSYPTFAKLFSAIAHARLLDAQGALCLDEAACIDFTVEGGAELMGPARSAVEAGVASIVLRLPPSGAAFKLQAGRATTTGSVSASLAWPPAPRVERTTAPAAAMTASK